MMAKQLTETRIAAAPRTIDSESRSVELVFSTGARVRRWTWDGEPFDEELVMTPEAVSLERLNNGASLLNSHASWSLDNILGVVERAWIEAGQGLAKVRFSERPAVTPIWRDVETGIIRQVSVGYQWSEVMRERGAGAGGADLYRVTRWEPYEISLVAVPADAGARVRSAPDARQQYEFRLSDAGSAAPGFDQAAARLRIGRMERKARLWAAHERSNYAE